MKTILLLLAISFISAQTSQAQFKETVQLATLTPTLLVLSSSEVKGYEKHHFSVSTIGYFGSYLITNSAWRAAAITLFLGAVKELVYDGLLQKGTPLWSDMMWNGIGVAQGITFTVSLRL